MTEIGSGFWVWEPPPPKKNQLKYGWCFRIIKQQNPGNFLGGVKNGFPSSEVENYQNFSAGCVISSTIQLQNTFPKVLKELITFLNILNKSHMVGKKTYLIFLTLNQNWILWKNIGKKKHIWSYIYIYISKKKKHMPWELARYLARYFEQWVFWWIRPTQQKGLRYAPLGRKHRPRPTAGPAAVNWLRSCIVLRCFVPPRKLTWNLKMMVSNKNLLFQGFIFRFHVSFPGCICKCI